MKEAATLIRIDTASTTAVYRQIVDAMRMLLVAGQYQPGQRVPSVRVLAGQLGVHHNTVAQAYRILAREGWLKLGRRRGAQVVDRPDPPGSATVGLEFARQLRELVAKAIADGLPVAKVGKELQALGMALQAEA